MEKTSLEEKKLLLEIRELEKPFWQKPAYLTIIISSLTVIISAGIGFSAYYTKVDEANLKTIDDQKKTIEDLKDQQHYTELAKRELEITQKGLEMERIDVQKSEAEEHLKQSETRLKTKDAQLHTIEAQISQSQSRYLAYKDSVKNVVTYISQYGPGYAKGLIESPSGQDAINDIMDIEDKRAQKAEIERFAYRVSEQAFIKTENRKSQDLGLGPLPGN